MKRGSALLMALWVIAVLSVMVLSFAAEAHLYTGVNVWVRERNRLNRLIEPGRILAEIVMLGYKDVKEPEITNGEPDWEDIFEEDDRWCKEKYALKNQTRCTIGPILLDDEDVNSGTVRIDIEIVNSGENGININQLYDGGDSDYCARWQQILERCGVTDELEVEVTEADGTSTKRRNLMNHLIACWNDWRKGTAASSMGPIKDDPDIESQDGDGAGVGRGEGEGHYYFEYYENLADEARGKDERERVMAEAYYPKEGEAHEISDIHELEYIRGFRDFPSILTGGYLYDNTPYEKDFAKERGSEVNPMLKGIVGLFGISGSAKIVINDRTTIDQLMTIPELAQGSGDADDEAEDNAELARAILDSLWIEPEDSDSRIAAESCGRKWWPYKDMNDLNTRLEETYNGSAELNSKASQYVEWNPSDTTVFKLKIVGETMGMTREVNAECYVKDKKVRYMKWRED